jgi:hypothetical protein
MCHMLVRCAALHRRGFLNQNRSNGTCSCLFTLVQLALARLLTATPLSSWFPQGFGRAAVQLTPQNAH